MGETAKEFAFYAGLSMVLLVLVRPGSQGSKLVSASGTALSGFARAVTGQ
jgi:hypothetical protein